MSALFPEPPSSELTDERVYARRREFLKQAGLFALTAAGVGGALLELTHAKAGKTASAGKGQPALPATATAAAPVKPRGRYDTGEPQTPYDTATHYNNYYEFGTDKVDPAENAHTLKTRPWTLVVDGLCKRPQTIDLDKLLTLFPLEERVYRMRCVEAWSMVLPWLGFPLGELVKRCDPLPSAKYLAFTTLYDPVQMPLTRSHVLEWPYREGLRLDEAMHPLALMTVGLYGRALLGQNGAPLRLVVPWKYGFKGVKSIVRMSFVAEQPYTTWADAASSEYGFYANVNPAVDHPRWSQARERRIGELTRRPTLPFNGYAEQVASLYSGMDLRKNF